MASTIPVQDVSAASSSSSDAKQYTIEQLKEHNSRDSLWMLLHGKVYDVTKFMDEVSFSVWHRSALHTERERETRGLACRIRSGMVVAVRCVALPGWLQQTGRL